MENYITNGEVKLWTEITGNNKENYIMLCNGGPGSPDYLIFG
ncbi:hypothetical protein V6B95_13130 [Thermoanaerobacterium saccharolyticum]|uniref:Uncharacterized protein n=2 Tax=Thermoanaerobacterium TaxID=28895 RepID=W9EDH2_9THEO|nr:MULTISPECIES: hypothetical protein [Thermoanaerobacterium]AFK86108.1 hypothetical protein Tsac_1095 [Thermoanaerobacterium saccharolyticum JW/SL-YS485]ETO39040.1 hypothetical protein V518_0815 [Thermoanaerobacterium aotearoense SCUT27]